MKVRVQYTYTVTDEDRKALNCYHHEKVTREAIAQTLQDLGVMGLEEQIVEGQKWLEAKALPVEEESPKHAGH